MVVFPNAKINLGLNVLRKREDGYHDISTVFVPYKGMSDVLEVVFADEPGMFQYGLDCGCEPEKNLCFKAYRLMAEKYGIDPVKIYLYKNIPSGSGLGGGSADAAFTLRLINDLFGLNLSDACLAADAATLGSDCAFFIYNRPMAASGRGEILQECKLSLEGYRVEVMVPPVHVSTAEAYRGVTPAMPAVPVEDIVGRPVEEWRGLLVNDFEESILATHPEIAAAKQSFYDRGAVYASMSGSGSSVFGIFNE
ncbi:MAG: 4-(cytidine 5'-diphospho)-2-C-methyl-D-erythritol kinase [Bacteroidales bacterium]|nr:4-(cytidine 5'-diphospho)-2-C-methyl-D-erythritol kinase [Bacteroidales bacterium]